MVSSLCNLLVIFSVSSVLCYCGASNVGGSSEKTEGAVLSADASALEQVLDVTASEQEDTTNRSK